MCEIQQQYYSNFLFTFILWNILNIQNIPYNESEQKVIK